MSINFSKSKRPNNNWLVFSAIFVCVKIRISTLTQIPMSYTGIIINLHNYKFAPPNIEWLLITFYFWEYNKVLYLNWFWGWINDWSINLLKVAPNTSLQHCSVFCLVNDKRILPIFWQFLMWYQILYLSM